MSAGQIYNFAVMKSEPGLLMLSVLVILGFYFPKNLTREE